MAKKSQSDQDEDLLAKGSRVSNPNLRAMSDLFIQYLFARERGASPLLDFINAVLIDRGLPLVTAVTVRNPFNIKMFEKDKRTILDVKAQDENGRWFDIEVQIRNHKAVRERFAYYLAKLYASQLEEGEDWRKLRPALAIILTGFTTDDTCDCVHRSYSLRQNEHPEFVYTDHLAIHELDIARFIRDSSDSVESRVNPQLLQWLRFFAYADKKDREDLMVEFANHPALQSAVGDYGDFLSDDQMRYIAEARGKFDSYVATLQSEAEEKGRAEGEARGEARGRAEGRMEGEMRKAREVARSMLRAGMEISTVANLTGLSVEDVQRLA